MQNLNAPTSAESDTTDSPFCNARSWNSIANLYSLSKCMFPQNVTNWINRDDEAGGGIVLAACSKGAPSVWCKAIQRKSHYRRFKGNMLIKERTVNRVKPVSAGGRGVSPGASSRRVLRRGRKGGG